MGLVSDLGLSLVAEHQSLQLLLLLGATSIDKIGEVQLSDEIGDVLKFWKKITL